MEGREGRGRWNETSLVEKWKVWRNEVGGTRKVGRAR